MLWSLLCVNQVMWFTQGGPELDTQALDEQIKDIMTVSFVEVGSEPLLIMAAGWCRR